MKTIKFSVFGLDKLWKRLFFAPIITTVLVFIPQLVSTEWHQFHGNATNRGSAELGPGVSYFSTPRFVVGDSLIAPSSPCVMNGRIFVYGVANGSGFVQAFDENTGDSLWTRPITLPGFGSWSSLSADLISNSVYIGSGNFLYRIDAVTGDSIWAVSTKYAVVNASPTINIDDNLIYINTYGGFGATTLLWAFNIANGDSVWCNELWGQGQGCPAYDANRSRVYFPVNVLHQWTSPGKIAAFDAVTGDEIWVSANTHSCACFGSATYDSKTGTVMAGGWNGSMLIVNADDGSFVIEANDIQSGGDYTPAIGKSYVYVTGDGGTAGINPTTGGTVWHTPGTGSWCSAACYAEDDGTGQDVVYVGGGGLYMLDADDGTILATYGSSGTGTPALANGNVYFIQRDPGKFVYDGKLVALGPVPSISVEELVDISREGFLSQNYPNPFSQKTEIRFQIPEVGEQCCSRQEFSLQIYDLAGRLVRSFPITSTGSDGQSHNNLITKVVWDGNDNHNNPVASGFYIYKLETEHFSKARKMLLLK